MDQVNDAVKLIDIEINKENGLIVNKDTNENCTIADNEGEVNLNVPLNQVNYAAEKDDDEDNIAPQTPQMRSFGFGSIASLDKSRPRFESTSKEKPPAWGWVIVIAAWIALTPIAGTLSSFGQLVDSLTSEYNSTKLITGWVGSLSFGFTVGMCPVSTIIETMIGARPLASIGVVLAAAGLVITTFVPSIYFMFFTYSMMVGSGANCVFNIAMNLVSSYFEHQYKILATSLASAGISTGTLVFNPLVQQLINKVGWRNNLRILAGICLVVGLSCTATFKRPQKKNRKEEEQELGGSKMILSSNTLVEDDNKKVDFPLSSFTNPGLLLWLFGTLFWSISFLFPHIFLVDYMRTINIDGSTSSMVLSVYGISELFGRFLCAACIERISFSYSYVYSICTIIAGIVALITPQVKVLPMMYFYAITAGINSGTLNALMYGTTTDLFGNKKGIHVWGYANVMLALGMVTGPIMAGGIYDATQSYEAAFQVGGSIFLLCSITMALIEPALKKYPFVKTKAEKYSSQKKKKTDFKNPPASHGGKWNASVHRHLDSLANIAEVQIDEADEEIEKS